MDVEGVKPFALCSLRVGALAERGVGLCMGVLEKGREEVEVMFSCPLSLAANCPALCEVLRVVCKC